ncbi:dihydroorotate oxidase electron transfer subunit [Actinoalloteichus sp. AHMU CJ021]|uniref:Dihydroorotate dehydrogenase electron transfer subunit n=1 Tax=Actinoalloteichus caeruleus DSM 43889 TaxID=1120930 RepID=A0ABT1JFP2_ACTCY|nr:dihydroorotate oxidase electron transfer subunit [Actinoalloteichus caeruleus]AUS77298.1 dihydroorotate oxidase electron transfer subunit [Actinoalloteichus sp. AHMU CJ021]MCP2331099.1 dihydroorotate dehydrogenase electron transfer subunit [Actinoalloteichus caeruleus DSM 43889]
MTAPLSRSLAERVVPLPPAARPEPTWDECRVVAHEPVGDRYHRLTLRAPSIADRALAGQFVMITIPESTPSRSVLPRPMAVHRRRPAEGVVEIVYGAGGAGTRALTEVAVGEDLLVTGPLGRGFTLDPGTRRVLVVGRGIGVCSVMGAVEDAVATGVEVVAVTSARTTEALVGPGDLAELGVERVLAVTDEAGDSAVPALRSRLAGELADGPPAQVFVCGSDRLAELCRSLGQEWGARVQVSLEAHMACGLGYCHGCATAATTTGSESPLICADGPVFALPTGGGDR